MNIKQIVSRIAKAEGRKHQASVGDVREIISLLCDLIGDDPAVTFALLDNAQRRKKRRTR